MPIGGPMIENVPATCPAGHTWGPPAGGVTRVITSWRPCHCTAVGDRGGHRTHHCEKPGCPSPWVLLPPCARDDPNADRGIHTRPELG